MNRAADRRPWLPGAAALAVLLGGCGPEHGTGFARIVTHYTFAPTDSYVLGQQALPALDGVRPGETTVSVPEGTTTLFLARGGDRFRLCEVPVRRNRITIVTLEAPPPSGNIRCRIEE